MITENISSAELIQFVIGAISLGFHFYALYYYGKRLVAQRKAGKGGALKILADFAVLQQVLLMIGQFALIVAAITNMQIPPISAIVVPETIRNLTIGIVVCQIALATASMLDVMKIRKIMEYADRDLP